VRKLAWLLAAVLVISLVGVSPARAYQPPGGGVFNTPKPWGGYLANYRIVRTVEKAMWQTRPTKRHRHPTMLVSTYLLDRSKSVDAMVAACRRGVSVRVLLDHDINNRNSRRLIRVLNADNVRDRNHDGKPDRKPRRGPCDSRIRHPKKHEHCETHSHRKGPTHKHAHGDRHRHRKAGWHVHAHPNGGSGQGGGQCKGKRGRNEAGLKAGAASRDKASSAKNSKPLSRAEARKSASRPTRLSVTWGKDRSYVKRCIGSCRGGGGNMHSKFFVFSRTGKARHVVMLSSSNLNRGGATLGWNDGFVMNNRPKLYDEFVTMHRKMTNDRRAGVNKVQVKDGPFLVRFFPMRNASKRNDPTLHDLNKIGCRSDLGRTQINVSMFYWKGRRGNYLATKLLDLARRGCKVSVIYGAPSLQMASRLRAAAARHAIRLYDSRWDHNQDGFNEVRTHAKYVLVKGKFGRDRDAWMVLTGSQNWVAGSLSRSDEVTLNINNRAAYNSYARNWNDVRRHSRRLPYSGWDRLGRHGSALYSPY